MNQEEFDRLTQQSLDNIRAKVICDSVNPNGCRLTTMEWKYPRFIHAEIMTHRKLSRNSASSRAIPLSKMIANVETCPVFPIHWGKNQKGMQADQELTASEKLIAAEEWMAARGDAIMRAKRLEALGIHKQLGNRLLEPWMWITVIVSATNFENLFALRCHRAAEPHFQNLSFKVRDAVDCSIPDQLIWGAWHLPLVYGYDSEELIRNFTLSSDIGSDMQKLAQVSAGRCARVSYLTHEGKRDPAEDIRLYNDLATHKPMHASPLEHPAQALNPSKSYGFPSEMLNDLQRTIALPIRDWGNFDPGWLQLRKMLPGECVTERGS